MLVAILYLGIHAGDPKTGTPNFSYDNLVSHLTLAPRTALWLFSAFFLAFAVKVPMFPFHTWLPDAHVEAPTGGSVILAAIMLKMGTFGFLRFALPLFPGAAMNPTVRTVVVVLAVIGIVYGALVAMVQPDFKKLVAYSSVSHLGFRDARHLRAHAAERAGRADGDDQPRHLDRSAVPPRRHDLRAAPYTGDQRLRRNRPSRASVRRGAHDRLAQQHRPPRNQRLRRRSSSCCSARSSLTRGSRGSRQPA